MLIWVERAGLGWKTSCVIRVRTQGRSDLYTRMMGCKLFGISLSPLYPEGRSPGISRTRFPLRAGERDSTISQSLRLLSQCPQKCSLLKRRLETCTCGAEILQAPLL